MRHPFESELALYAGGDLQGWDRLETAWHVRGCEACRSRVEAFRLDRERLANEADELPPGVNWDRLSAEMTANIRVGLAAGECVAPVTARKPEPLSLWNWRPAAAAAGLVMVFGLAWWLNVPPSDTAALRRAFGVSPRVNVEERGPVVEASSAGIESRENGSALGVGADGSRPVSVSVSFGGSASARFVDDDTGQVTITTVYVQ